MKKRRMSGRKQRDATVRRLTIGMLSLSLLTSSSSASAHQGSYNHDCAWKATTTNNITPSLSTSSIHCRGGELLIPSENEEEIDAFIDKLVANVSDSSTSDPTSDNEEEEETLKQENMEDIAEATQHAVWNTQEEARKELAEEESEADESESESEDTSETVIAQDSSDKEDDEDASEDEKAAEELKAAAIVAERSRKSKPLEKDLEQPDIETESFTETLDLSSHTSQESTTAIVSDPPKPPNGLYRFLLRRGRVGHVLVLSMIMLLKWIQIYLPPVHSLLLWLYESFAPDFITQPPAPIVPSKPTKSSRKTFAKHADAMALAQLKRVGNIYAAKYRYCSEAFLQRHTLGIVSNKQSQQYQDEDKDLINVVSKVLETKKKHVEEEDADEDVDWIVEALTADQVVDDDDDHTRHATTMDVSLHEYDDGVELSSLDQKRFLLQQALRQSNSKRKTTILKPRVSDRNAGMLGRIRAGVGSNSMSRSIFGAYPGDAVPITEAANAEGVIELARRYGYGDWSDVDSDDNGEDFGMDEPKRMSSSSRRKRRGEASRKKRRRQTSEYVLNDDFGGGVATSKRSHQTTRKRRQHPASLSVGFEFGMSTSSSKPIRSSTERVAKATKKISPSSNDDAIRIRPAGESLQKIRTHSKGQSERFGSRRQERKWPSDVQPNRPPLSSLNDANARRFQQSKPSDSIEKRLNELRQKPNNDSRKDE
jgi:hypothetical protein